MTHNTQTPAPVDALARVAILAEELAEERGNTFAPADTFRTLYTPEGAPALTLTRARIIGGDSMNYAHAVDGRPVAVFTGNPPLAQLARALRAFVRAGAGLDSMTARELGAEAQDADAREADNRARAEESQIPTFRASALSRALRAEYRAQLAREALRAAVASAPEPQPFRVALTHRTGRSATTTIEARTAAEACQLADAEHGPDYQAGHAWPASDADAGAAIGYHFCPGCEAEGEAPGLCFDCEERAQHGSPAAVDIRREELAQRHAATGFRAVMGQGGAFPLWALAAERAASAIDDALELGLDLADPFAPGWADTEELGPLWG